MPLCCLPGQRYPITLESDKKLDPQPTFWARHLTGREWKFIADAAEMVDEKGAGSKAIDSVYEALGVALCSWQDVKNRDGKELPFEQKYFADALDPMEANEVLGKIMVAQQVGYEDAKKSASPSASSTASSATARKGQASAETAPTK